MTAGTKTDALTMASSVELAGKIADGLGIGRETLGHHLRNLRKHDLISYRGQGRNAAAMTPLDAARLTIAAAGSFLVKESFETWQRYASLPRTGHASAQDAADGSAVTAINFEMFLAGRIAWWRDQEMPSPEYGPVMTRGSDRLARVALELCRPVGDDGPSYAVVRWHPVERRAESAYFSESRDSSLASAAEYFAWRPEAGQLSARYVSENAMRLIARSLRGGQ